MPIGCSHAKFPRIINALTCVKYAASLTLVASAERNILEQQRYDTRLHDFYT
jgi:hypothetical protein